MASTAASTACCPLCHGELDDTKDDIVVVSCSISSCDKDVTYHAECTRVLQLSKRSTYHKQLKNCKQYSPATWDLKHCECVCHKRVGTLCWPPADLPPLATGTPPPWCRSSACTA